MEWIVCSEWDWPLSTCRCEECEGEGFVQVWLDEYDSCEECAGIGVLFDWEMIEDERWAL